MKFFLNLKMAVKLAIGFGLYPLVEEPWQAFGAAAVAGLGNAGFWPSQSALLAGLPQAPSVFSPFQRPDDAVRRRNEVLRAMLDAGFIDQRQYEEASRLLADGNWQAAREKLRAIEFPPELANEAKKKLALMDQANALREAGGKKT